MAQTPHHLPCCQRRLVHTGDNGWIIVEKSNEGLFDAEYRNGEKFLRDLEDEIRLCEVCEHQKTLWNRERNKNVPPQNTSTSVDALTAALRNQNCNRKQENAKKTGILDKVANKFRAITKQVEVQQKQQKVINEKLKVACIERGTLNNNVLEIKGRVNALEEQHRVTRAESRHNRMLADKIRDMELDMGQMFASMTEMKDTIQELNDRQPRQDVPIEDTRIQRSCYDVPPSDDLYKKGTPSLKPSSDIFETCQAIEESILTNCGGRGPMIHAAQEDDSLEKRIQNNWRRFISDMDPMDISAYLYEKEILSKEKFRAVGELRHTVEQNTFLLNHVIDVGEEGCHVMKEGLMENQKHLAKLL